MKENAVVKQVLAKKSAPKISTADARELHAIGYRVANASFRLGSMAGAAARSADRIAQALCEVEEALAELTDLLLKTGYRSDIGRKEAFTANVLDQLLGASRRARGEGKPQ